MRAPAQVVPPAAHRWIGGGLYLAAPAVLARKLADVILAKIRR